MPDEITNDYRNGLTYRTFLAMSSSAMAISGMVSTLYEHMDNRHFEAADVALEALWVLGAEQLMADRDALLAALRTDSTLVEDLTGLLDRMPGVNAVLRQTQEGRMIIRALPSVSIPFGLR